MKKKIYEFLNNAEKYADGMAKEIVETFVSDANEDNIDYNFTISRKTGQVFNKESNTYFVFDTVEQTILNDFKKALFNEDLSKIQENSNEEKELMTDVRIFLLKVCTIITKAYYKELQQTIRRVILGDKVDVKGVPLNNIEVISIDLADYSSVPDSSKYMLKIGKIPDSDINTDEVIKFVQNRQEKTGMDLDTIFSIEKKAGNPLFENIEAIILGRKFLNEISIYFFVDYSVVEQNKNKKVLDKISDSEK